jgi:prolyl-tRNA synthetase
MTDKFEKKELKKKSENLSDWYNDVVLKAELADYGPAKGTMVIRPYGYAIWETVQKIMDSWFKEYGVQNAYFPLLIPMSLLSKEKEHVSGFSPELAVVTHGGGKELTEPLVVRPTSETIMYQMYKKWIKSWRDLPYLINQWNNVVRWELRTYLFLRTSEFLWQEGHTVHADEGSAMEMVLTALEWYRRVYEEYFAIPVIAGVKSDSEKFAGAKKTYTVEALMPDGKALQGGTSHNLGQNFAKAFDLTFQSKEGKQDLCWQTSWGFSTRSLGGLFLVHGDDNGVIVPPKIAPTQVVIIPIYAKGAEHTELDNYVEGISEDLKKRNIRVFIDRRESQSAGRKFNDWEVKGVPLRFEIGDRERAENKVTMVKRNTGEKLTFVNDGLGDETYNQLDTIQQEMFAKAQEFLAKNTFEADTYDRFKEIMATTRGFIKAYWCEDASCEAKIKEETKATTRVKPLDLTEGKTGNCIYCGKPAKDIWYFGQSY